MVVCQVEKAQSQWRGRCPITLGARRTTSNCQIILLKLSHIYRHFRAPQMAATVLVLLSFLALTFPTFLRMSVPDPKNDTRNSQMKTLNNF